MSSHSQTLEVRGPAAGVTVTVDPENYGLGHENYQLAQASGQVAVASAEASSEPHQHPFYKPVAYDEVERTPYVPEELLTPLDWEVADEDPDVYRGMSKWDPEVSEYFGHREVQRYILASRAYRDRLALERSQSSSNLT